LVRTSDRIGRERFIVEGLVIMADNVLGPLSVSSKIVNDVVVITPSGDIDLSGSPLLRQELKKGQGKKIVVDLTGVPYMDSSGLATLVEAMQASRRGSGQLVLCNLSDRVRSIFAIAKLETVFKLAATLDDAMAK
jgi:anti-sigma B factor antagonist